MLPHEHDDYFDRGICATVEQLRKAVLPPDVEMRVESIIANPPNPIPHRDAEDNGAIFLPRGSGIHDLNDRDYAALKEGLDLA